MVLALDRVQNGPVNANPIPVRDVHLAGLLAGMVSLSVLYAASTLLSDAPFAPAAAGEALIRWVPGDISTFFIEVLKHWARRLVTVGALGAALGLGVLVLTATTGPRGPRPALAAGMLAVVAAAGSFVSPSQVANPAQVVLAVTIAFIAYVLTARSFLAMVAGARAEPDEGRRRVIRVGVGTAAGVAVGGTALGYVGRMFGGPNTEVTLVAPTEPVSAPVDDGFPDIPGLSPEITPVADHYVVDINLVQPAVDATGWKLRVFGAVDNPLELTFRQLQQRFEVVEEYSVLCCVSNEVGGDLVGNSAWGGVRLADVLGAAGVKEGAMDLVFRAADGYSDSVPLTAVDESVLLAVSQNGKPLTQQHGFPCRVRIPKIFGMKNVKWLESIELVPSDYVGYWQERGWSDEALVRTQSRIDVAGDDGTAATGEEVWIAGIAWAGDRGIDRVEVTTDGGETWSEARLKRPAAADAWTLWAYRWTPERAGETTVAVRATDGDGNTQTATAADPHPSGATGYHTRVVRVS